MRFALNAAGRDFAVGDIHGHFSRLEEALSEVGFDVGVAAVVCEHSTVPSPLVLGNVFHIDTGGWTEGGRFTVLELGSLACG